MTQRIDRRMHLRAVRPGRRFREWTGSCGRREQSQSVPQQSRSERFKEDRDLIARLLRRLPAKGWTKQKNPLPAAVQDLNVRDQ